MRAFVCAAVVFASACGGASLPNSYETPEALSRAVLTAFERRDLDTLLKLALDKREFEEYVWPDLPAAKPERNLSVNFVWGDLNQKSNITLHESLAAHAGKKYEFVAIRFLGETSTYGSYVVRRESELTVKDADGARRDIRFFGSVLEKGGRFKVFSYVIDD